MSNLLEKFFYEARPYAFLFVGLKAMTSAENSALLFFSGALLVAGTAVIMMKRFAYRGYFGLAPAPVGGRRR